MKKIILKEPLYTACAIVLLVALFAFTFYYFSHDTVLIPDHTVADPLLVASKEE